MHLTNSFRPFIPQLCQMTEMLQLFECRGAPHDVCRRPARKAPTVGSGPLKCVHMCVCVCVVCGGEGIDEPYRNFTPHSDPVLHCNMHVHMYIYCKIQAQADPQHPCTKYVQYSLLSPTLLPHLSPLPLPPSFPLSDPSSLSHTHQSSL